MLEKLQRTYPWEAGALRGLALARSGDYPAAAPRIHQSLRELRNNPWPRGLVCGLIVDSAVAGSRSRRSSTEDREFFEAVSEPFTLYRFEEDRAHLAYNLAAGLKDPVLIVRALAPVEPHVPWDLALLRTRADAYRKTNHPLAARALRELELFRKQAD